MTREKALAVSEALYNVESFEDFRDNLIAYIDDLLEDNSNISSVFIKELNLLLQTELSRLNKVLDEM